MVSYHNWIVYRCEDRWLHVWEAAFRMWLFPAVVLLTCLLVCSTVTIYRHSSSSALIVFHFACTYGSAIVYVCAIEVWQCWLCPPLCVSFICICLSVSLGASCVRVGCSPNWCGYLWRVGKCDSVPEASRWEQGSVCACVFWMFMWIISSVYFRGNACI